MPENDATINGGKIICQDCKNFLEDPVGFEPRCSANPLDHATRGFYSFARCRVINGPYVYNGKCPNYEIKPAPPIPPAPPPNVSIYEKFSPLFKWFFRV